MTRKKTTTGTMGSKRKTTKADKAPKSDASKVATPAESKASEVIAPVAIALLAAHPTLPDREDILLTFAAHYVEAQARHVALAAQPEPEPEPVKPVGKKGRTPFQPPTLPSMRPVDLGHAPGLAPQAETLPDLQWDATTGAAAESVEAEPDAAFAEPEESDLAYAESVAPEAYPEVFEDEEPAAVDTNEAGGLDEEDPFATLDESPGEVEDDADDFFARLQAQGEAALDGKSSMFEEVDFSAHHPSDQSSPFITSPLVAEPEGDEGRTTMIAAFPDDEDELLAAPSAVEPEPEPEPELEQEEAAAFAEPNESTMMIAAITDEDIEAATGASEDGAEAKPARKSRKSSKKKRA
jgi:hypothetical protein